jgi:hypothetical protein
VLSDRTYAGFNPSNRGNQKQGKLQNSVQKRGLCVCSCAVALLSAGGDRHPASTVCLPCCRMICGVVCDVISE